MGEGGEYGTAQPEHVLEGYTIGTEEGIKSGTMPNRGAVTHTITTQGGSYTIPAGYHNGSGKVTANFANLVASNIKKGVNIGGVVGTFVGGWSYYSVDVPVDLEYPPSTSTTANINVPRGPITSISQIKMLIIEFEEVVVRVSGIPRGGGYRQKAVYVAEDQYPYSGVTVGYAQNGGGFELKSITMSGSNIVLGFDVYTGSAATLSVGDPTLDSYVQIYYQP